MPIKSKVFMKTLQKSQNRHKISFAIELNNKNIKKFFGANLPPPNTIKLEIPTNTIRLKVLARLYAIFHVHLSCQSVNLV